jgi:endonuclease YncB( thermonuclease family)
MQITPENYKKLLSKIQATIAKTKQNIVKSVDRQKVEMSWKIGRDIEGELKGKDKAKYGKELFKKLTQDTAIEKTTLYQMHAFYKTYPKLPSEKAALSWSHYRNLIVVRDAQTRAQIENLVVEKNLGSDKLQQEISKTKKVKKKSVRRKDEDGAVKLRVTRGQVFNYKISGAAEIDLGFNVFVEVKHAFKTGEIVTVKKLGEKFLLKKSALKSNQIHTYKAELERVVDGDTIHVKLDLGFKIKHREILRLAQIDAAEFATEEGQKSFEALKKILKDAPFLVVKTNKTDIYGRYVADIFLGEKGEMDAQKIADEGVYLSQLLLDRGLVKVWG